MVTAVAIVCGALHSAGGFVAFSLATCLFGVWLMAFAVERGSSAYLGGIILSFGAIGLLLGCLFWAEAILQQSIK